MNDHGHDDTGAAARRAAERRDPARAQAVIEGLYPDAVLRKVLLTALADSIDAAHAAGPGAWEITLKISARIVRLNIGAMLAFDLRDREVVLAVESDGIETGLRDELRRTEAWGERFAVVENARLVHLGVESFGSLWPRLQAGHRSVLARAAARHTRSPWARAHSPAVIEYLSRELGRELPQPAYGVEDSTAVASAAEPAALVPQRRAVIMALLPEFRRDYVDAEAGRQHVQLYAGPRADAARSWHGILAARERGEDITDAVLLRLLPHADTDANRARGVWIHWAPAVSSDVRTWFENAGWAKPTDWPVVADAIVKLVERAVADPTDLDAALGAFIERCPAKGFQTGMLTPILNALRPDAFVLVNNKSRRLINYLGGTDVGHGLAQYPQANVVARVAIDDLAASLCVGTLAALVPDDAFDMLSHWLVAVKSFDFGARRCFKVAPGAGASEWDACRMRGFIGIGWAELGDLSNLSRAEFVAHRDALVRQHAGERGWSRAALTQVWRFSRLDAGDRIVANRGTDTVLGVGTVTGPYYFVTGVWDGHRVPVRWDDVVPRRVEQPGWRRTLVRLALDDVESMLALPPLSENEPAQPSGEASAAARTAVFGPPATDAAFEPRAFELLAGLHEQPTRAFYGEHKADFERHVEEPLRRLLQRVAATLPDEMQRLLECEKNVFGRFLKNDYGRGGAWDFLWGAFYPKEGKRTEGAQLFVWVNCHVLEFGFAFGAYASAQERTFVDNCRRHAAALEGLLGERLAAPGLYLGLDPGPRGGGQPTQRPDWRAWLRDPERAGLKVALPWPAAQVVATPAADLVRAIHATFEALFPLVLLATSDDLLRAVSVYVGASSAPEVEFDLQPIYTTDDVAREAHVEPALVERWVRAIERKRQAILYGPPGTGKTFLAEKLARHLVAGGDGIVEVVQFHPAYAYEDFIQGLRPRARSDGGLDYAMLPGRFVDFCQRAARRRGRSVLVIDEINRANLARVFGELMYLLEYRGESVPLAGGERSLKIPEQVCLLGTMNTADRSIALVDHALRRRFAFIALRPDYEALRRCQAARGITVEGLIAVLRELNAEIGDAHYEVGISFFTGDDLRAQVEDIWRMEIEPYLEEYFFDQPAKLERFRWDRVAARLPD